ncbi:MAG: DUF2252 domain-containing protein [Pseudomonadota bacterium]|nr:DUF2252 domain-containing protein [Pseudomonadota bacterium]
MNAVAEIQAYNAGRDADRLKLKYAAMRGSPFAFLRGSCHLFYARLSRDGIFKSAPLSWCCGDLHLENFGSYKADNRLVHFDINDFDEAALAPATCDLVRMLTSLRIAADGVAIKASDGDHLCSVFVDTYATALTSGKAYWVERETSEGVVRSLLDELRTRQRPDFLDTRTVLKGKKRVLRTDGVKALAVSEAQRQRVTNFMDAFAKTQPKPDFYSVLDVGRRIAGTGSLGVDRYVILVRGKGSPNSNYLLDLKQAAPSTLARRVRTRQPSWRSEADRIVSVQRRMQAVSFAFLHPVLVGAEPFVLRALQPSEDRITLRAPRQSTAELEPLIQTMGRLTAWAHLRSGGRQGSASADEFIDFGKRRKRRLRLLDASETCASQVRTDAKAFNAAYDVGALAGAETVGPLSSNTLGPRSKPRST